MRTAASACARARCTRVRGTRAYATCAFAGLLLACSLPAWAIGARDGNAIAHRLADAIEANYVEPEIAKRAARMLRRGTWSAPDEATLAGRLTETLRKLDGHFSVRYKSPAADAPSAPADKPAYDYEAAGRFRNFGFREVTVLRGNVGYIDLRQFASVADAGDTAVAAMAAVANSHSVIIDLRRNGGGEPAMVQLLCSYFLGPGVHLNSLYWRPTDTTDQFWTLPLVPGKRMLEQPLYLLIGQRTGSAAEEFANNLRVLKRATLIGTTTYGAANPGDVIDLGDGWSAFISNGKAVNPITGSNWEGIGVEPHIDVPHEQALEHAHVAALEARASMPVSDQEARELDWALAFLTANGVPNGELFANSIGRYGDRTISWEDGALYYTRAARPRERLASTADGLHFFATNDRMRIEIRTDDTGQGIALAEVFIDGFTRSFPRSNPENQ